ncbi:1,6-anhydro-N-acetylmuramyl-L-alanine amidase AmpD [Parashewanella spongiae]|uniref:1,6-anhydro-N-acetylmuramyl-L-alanine amidase AmpD n=1 Tax=Parashewanella spongiae TaxID=342950 RepID=A0A3A6TVS1_9GAMM|nr:1,6-anhydro-N-acetylmuramyl-L-alanine amidase AmpD [Parashewanella spongiae]MCL1077442.1 1,6-anhydro-N-acetylmuramyl-L-alanine amidase AmpD [Parashewanella spongiae]RJY18417.1 1,6-anhydro-N-acetylmuramyl-L-alanine amidase AmpD [Parashewanella spongiae]
MAHEWKSGWFIPAQHRESPHFNARPTAEVSLLVIHNISLPAGKFGQRYVDDLFMGKLDYQADNSFHLLEGIRVSANFFIRRDGELIQYVSCDDRAWHAGVSEFEGRSGCNDFSIGIELEGTDHQPFTHKQYQQLIQLTRAIMAQYPDITKQRITGHSDIAPERKTDPGPYFDWQYYLTQLC